MTRESSAHLASPAYGQRNSPAKSEDKHHFLCYGLAHNNSYARRPKLSQKISQNGVIVCAPRSEGATTAASVANAVTLADLPQTDMGIPRCDCGSPRNCDFAHGKSVGIVAKFMGTP